MSVFGADYAGVYDLVYQDKDYASECELLENIFTTYSTGAVRRILDLGCGTGNHAIPLARRGYEVTGIDRSTEMLEMARAKAAEGRVAVDLHAGDVRSVDLGAKYDVVMLLFAVLGYQLSDEDVTTTLDTARNHVGPGGILLFDVWHGPAVLSLKPERRAKEIVVGGLTLRRISTGELIEGQPVCSVTMTVSESRDEKVLSQTSETHLMRYFFPDELREALSKSGFDLLRVGAFPEFDRDPDASTWNVMYAAAAV